MANFCPRCGIVLTPAQILCSNCKYNFLTQSTNPHAARIARTSPANLPPLPLSGMTGIAAIDGAFKPAGMAIAARIVGIVACCLFCMPYFSIPCAIVAIILGSIASGKASRGEASGAGAAKAGVILGTVALCIGALLIIIFFAAIGARRL